MNQIPETENPATPLRFMHQRPDQTFTCSTKRKCGDMLSCAEARFYLEECGRTRLDGDGDGVPCELLCR